MDRKEFVGRLVQIGVAAAAAPMCCAEALAQAADKKVPPLNCSMVPVTDPDKQGHGCDRSFSHAQRWVKRFMDVLDEELDQATRNRIMERNGQVCFVGAYGPRKELPDAAGLETIVKKWGLRREGNDIYFDYVQNPQGMKVASGWCLCEVVAKGPENLSGTYCQCSVGYVREMFSRFAGKEVRVELLESLKRGGKACRFKISV